jgi:sigma-54 dependent transcriptional regulator, flagellar regulatory protein
MRRLQEYHWPGNIRELSNLMARFTVLMPGERIDIGRLPPAMLPKALADIAQSAPPPARAVVPMRVEKTTHDHHAALEALVGGADPVEAPTVRTALTAASPGGVDAQTTCGSGESAVGKGEADKTMDESADDAADETADGPSSQSIDDGPRPIADILSLVHDLHEFPEDGVPLKQRLADIERKLILQALERSEGNVSKTARLLSLQRTTLIEKLNKYDLRLP